MLTRAEQKALDAFTETGSKCQAAKRLGVARSTIRATLKRVEQKGCAPWLSPAQTPEHLKCAKTTVQYDGQGKVVQEWKRLSPSIEALKDVAEGLCESVKGKGKATPRKARKTDTDTTLFEMDIYDAHVGMYADERETLDEDYDCDIAARKMVEAAEGLAARASRPGKVVLVFGGDMLHADNRSNQTEHSGNVLDVDTRYQRVVSYIIKASRDVVQICAAVGQEVEVVVLRGNHSWHSEAWLAQVLNAYYCDCPNVTVSLCRSPRQHTVWGKNLICWAHGDKIKPGSWAQIVAAEFPEQWGQTRHRYMRCGHVHHAKTIAPVVVDEQAGLMVEYVPALCPSDAWHTDSGFVGTQKGAVAVEYDKAHGQVSRYYQPI